jgi:peroxiredoxin
LNSYERNNVILYKEEFMKKFSLWALALALGSYALPSNAAQVGKKAPAFTLTDTNGKSHSLSDFAGKTVVLEWLNHDCPYVVKHYDSGNMQKLQKEYTAKDVIWLSINSSAEGKQGNFPPAKANELTQSKKAAPTAVLLDPQGTVGRAYEAKVTPHMYVINPEGVLVYNGAIDDKPTTNKDDIAKAKSYIVAALDEVLAGKPVSLATSRPYGCTVKYP